MHGSEQKRYPDLSQFYAMSTEELREILRNDALKKEDDASLNIDSTLYIAGEIASREDKPDADAAWEEFERSYLPDAGKRTLYEEILADSNEPAAAPTRPKAKHRLLRFSLIAAAIVLVLSATAFAAAKIGWFPTWNATKLWSRRARNERSVQVTPLPKPPYYDEMAEALNSIDVPAHMIPLWIPEGYEMTTIEANTTATIASCIFGFSGHDQQYILLQYLSYADSDAYLYSIDEGSPDIYTAGGIKHSILANMESYGAVWWRENYECYIYGYESKDDLIKTIDSLYMEVQND